MNISKSIETDVLVIGGSGAGVSAAISAYKEGAKVIVASKGKIGKSGNAIMAGGAFSIDGESAHNLMGISSADQTHTKKIRFDNMVKESCFVGDQNMIRQFVDDSGIAVKEFFDWHENWEDSFMFAPPGFWISAGKYWGQTIKKGIKKHDQILVLEDMMIIDLIVEDNVVKGAIGLDIYSGDFITIHSKAVIIGSGGFQPYSFKNTVTDATGDGLAMAARQGVSLSDMEYLLFFPTIAAPNEMKGSVFPYLFEMILGSQGLVADYYNNDGEKIEYSQTAKNLASLGKLGKLISTYYWGQHIERGLGNEVNAIYWDYSKYSTDEKEGALKEFTDFIQNFHRKGYYQGEKLAPIINKMMNNERLEVAPCCEYSNGGIVVNERMETKISGLFAAGEATSGVFGAMRVGDGLTEMLAQGYRAGKVSAEYATKTNISDFENTIVDDALDKVNSLLKNENGKSAYEIKSMIEEVADIGFNHHRNEERFVLAYEKLEVVKSEIGMTTIREKSLNYNLELVTALQNENLLLCLEAGLMSARERKESRGSHIRTDYPKVDNDSWLKKSICTLNQGDILLTYREPNLDVIVAPKGQFDNVIDFYADERTNYKKYMTYFK